MNTFERVYQQDPERERRVAIERSYLLPHQPDEIPIEPITPVKFPRGHAISRGKQLAKLRRIAGIKSEKHD